MCERLTSEAKWAVVSVTEMVCRLTYSIDANNSFRELTLVSLLVSSSRELTYKSIYMAYKLKARQKHCNWARKANLPTINLFRCEN